MSSAWPIAYLRIESSPLELRALRDDEIEALAVSAAGRLFAPEQRHFMGAWTQLPSPQFERGVLQYNWEMRAQISPARWNLQFGVFAAGEQEPVGCAAISAENFARLRSVGTGSWLLPEWRGRGLGREARACLLELAFRGLGAREARSGAVPDNLASLAVSRSLGYIEDGTELQELGGGPQLVQRVWLPRERWRPRPDVEIVGLEPCLPLLGL